MDAERLIEIAAETEAVNVDERDTAIVTEADDVKLGERDLRVAVTSRLRDTVLLVEGIFDSVLVKEATMEGVPDLVIVDDKEGVKDSVLVGVSEDDGLPELLPVQLCVADGVSEVEGDRVMELETERGDVGELDLVNDKERVSDRLSLLVAINEAELVTDDTSDRDVVAEGF